MVFPWPTSPKRPIVTPEPASVSRSVPVGFKYSVARLTSVFRASNRPGVTPTARKRDPDYLAAGSRIVKSWSRRETRKSPKIALTRAALRLDVWSRAVDRAREDAGHRPDRVFE